MNLAESLKKGLKVVAKDFTRAKRKAAAANRDTISAYEYDRLVKNEKKEQIKAAAYKHMKAAYFKASANGTLPANARQVMYAARPLILAEPDITDLDDTYFTQHLLPDYQKDNPKETAAWDVVYDARGHFTEPHTGISFGVGTLEVRDYRRHWKSNSASTHGPDNRFRYVLFIEKEGFDPLLQESGIADRYDLGISSSKGQSTTATRMLFEALSDAGVTILVAHDFDIYGLSICHNLSHDTRRYEFQSTPAVIDLGLRLKDVKTMGLDGEPVVIEQTKDPAERLFEYEGVIDEEMDYLCGQKGSCCGAWRGLRVELNAMTSQQFIDWLELKFEEHGVEKVIPEADLLGKVWQSEHRKFAYDKFAEKRLKEIQKDFDEQYKEPKTPKDLQGRVARYFETDQTASWNGAIDAIALADTKKRTTKSKSRQ
jgi:hypothetical protein